MVNTRTLDEAWLSLKIFQENKDIINDIYQKYHKEPITYMEYFSVNEDYRVRCEKLASRGIIRACEDNNYMEILEPYISFFEKIVENTGFFADREIDAFCEELTKIEKRILSAQENQRVELENALAKTISRAFTTADRGSVAIDNDRRKAIFEIHSYEEKIIQLEEITEKSQKVLDYLDEISEFINKPIVRQSNNRYLIQEKYNFRKNLPVVVKRLQDSLKSSMKSISIYEKKQNEIIELRKIIEVLNKHPEDTNIDKLPDEYLLEDPSEFRNCYSHFLYPGYMIDSESKSIQESVMKFSKGDEDTSKNKPSKINLNKPKPPKVLKIGPSDDKLMSDFFKSGSESLFRFIFNHKWLESIEIKEKYNIYIRCLRRNYHKVKPSGNIYVIQLEEHKMRIKDYIIK